MTNDQPLTELLARIAALRSAIDAERTELRRLDLDRVSALDRERAALDAAWRRLCAGPEGRLEAAGNDATWAERQLRADLASLEEAETAHRQRAVERTMQLQTLQRLLSDADQGSPTPANVVPLRRTDE